MGKIIILLTYIGNMSSFDSNYQNAFDTSRRALMEDKDTKKDIEVTTDKVEKWANRRLGVTKEDLVWAAYGAPLVTQTVSTKPFKNLKTTFYGFTVRPEIDYKFNGDPERFKGMLILIKEF